MSGRRASDPALDYARRVDVLRSGMDDLRLAACILVAPANQAYFTGFRTIYYPRPVLVVVGRQTTTLVIPLCEEHEARATAHVDAVATYVEQPGNDGPASHLECLADCLRTLPAGSTVGVESDVCPVQLAEAVANWGLAIADVGELAASARERKDERELDLLREAARLTELAFAASVQAIRIGLTELEADAVGNAAASAGAAEVDRPASLELFVITASGAERTTFPHTISTNRQFEHGDVVCHSRQVGLAGYRAELERTLFVGRATAAQARVFDAVRRAQQAAIEAVRPGARCNEVDRVARDVLADAGLAAHALHRTGHGLGLATGRPYLRFDNPAPLEEGMVVTVEPGVYQPGLGGYRHSDTLVVTAQGAEVMTSFPTDLAALTVG